MDDAMAKLEFFHLTPAKRAAAIRRDGIKADSRGDIFVFTDMVVANEIAKSQVFAKRYTVFEIDRQGVTGRFRRDNVAELAAANQRIIRQSRIEAKFLATVGTFDVITDRPVGWDYFVGSRMGLTTEQVDGRFEISNWINHQTKLGRLSSDEILAEANRRLKSLFKQPNRVGPH